VSSAAPTAPIDAMPEHRASIGPHIDDADKNDPLAACPFIPHMMSFYKRTEPKVRVADNYMTNQSDINDKMRAILIDWLVDVHIKFKLMPETLYLTVNLIDRFLEVKQVTRKHLQLVGVTAMLIASKYEEIWAPEVRDFVYISDRAYSRDQILNMEKIMLNVLRFNLTVPTHLHFMQRFLKAAGIVENKEIVAYATYLMELALPDYSMLKFNYSLIAASAVSAACSAYGKGSMPRALVRHSGYNEAALRDCVDALGALYRKAPSASLTAVFKKFSTEKYHNVANRDVPTRFSDAHMDA
jgi:cyclin B